jgi:hypothetical protein
MRHDSFCSYTRFVLPRVPAVTITVSVVNALQPEKSVDRLHEVLRFGFVYGPRLATLRMASDISSFQSGAGCLSLAPYALNKQVQDRFRGHGRSDPLLVENGQSFIDEDSYQPASEGAFVCCGGQWLVAQVVRMVDEKLHEVVEIDVVAYLLAVDRRKQNFVPAEEFRASQAA